MFLSGFDVANTENLHLKVLIDRLIFQQLKNSKIPISLLSHLTGTFIDLQCCSDNWAGRGSTQLPHLKWSFYKLRTPIMFTFHPLYWQVSSIALFLFHIHCTGIDGLDWWGVTHDAFQSFRVLVKHFIHDLYTRNLLGSSITALFMKLRSQFMPDSKPNIDAYLINY